MSLVSRSPGPGFTSRAGICGISRLFALRGRCGIMNKEMPPRPQAHGRTAPNHRFLFSMLHGRRCLVDSRRPTSLPAENHVVAD